MEHDKIKRDDAAIKAPLTPPPEYEGLALKGIATCFDDKFEPPQEIRRNEAAAYTNTSDLQALNVRVKSPANTRSASSGPDRFARQQMNSTGLNESSKDLGVVEKLAGKEFHKSPDTRIISGDGEISGSEEQRNSTGLLSPALSAKDFDASLLASKLSGSLSPLVEGESLRLSSPPLTTGARKPSHETQEMSRPRVSSVNEFGNRVVVHNSSLNSRPRAPRALSTPINMKSPALSSQEGRKTREGPRPDYNRPPHTPGTRHALPSPIQTTLSMPPLSLSNYLQLELSSQRNTSMHTQYQAEDFPYESSRVKLERLLNFLFLPVQLEALLWFGVLACLDTWLYTFTILPLRMIKSITILTQSFFQNVVMEVRFIASFIYGGIQRVWVRRRLQAASEPGVLSRQSSETVLAQQMTSKARQRSSKPNKRAKSVPSKLQPEDKADILKGFLIIATCAILLRFDASRMYHWVRGQAAIKLYVIYNLLEVCDRLLSALGQDVLECLFSRETLERKPDGHSKIFRPLWLFVLALIYCTTHATALFYQVITLNVAVNSYSNALITLLMSNQFVEIKGTVFKKFEKENLFQLTCADVVERFQLWHMLMIIASRNIVETGVFTIGSLTVPQTLATATTTTSPNITQAVPLSAVSILPRSFMLLPSMLNSVTSYVPTVSHVLGPFVIVLGSEMFIDWLKHAYIGKFNNTRPVIYARFLDILTKDYFTNAFGDQNLTKRLGLPVIPLSCLMIRAGFQTYQMFVASWVPSTAEHESATLASLQQAYSTTRAEPKSTTVMLVRKFDDLISALPTALSSPSVSSWLTTILVLLLMFLILLVFKLSLGMFLLAVSRSRYKSMKEREKISHTPSIIEGGRRVGGWGSVEVDDEKRRLIYEDDPAALQALRARESKLKAKMEQEAEKASSLESSLSAIRRFELSAGAKRIW